MADQPTLHARLLTATQQLAGKPSAPTARAVANQALAALRAVVELHKPVDAYGAPFCHGCDKAHATQEEPAWPCATIRTIARELGINAEEDHRA
jgi:hypothetical protein